MTKFGTSLNLLTNKIFLIIMLYLCCSLVLSQIFPLCCLLKIAWICSTLLRIPALYTLWTPLGWPLCLKSIVLVLVRRKNGKNSWQCSGWVCESVFKRETPLFLSNVEQIHCPLLPNHWQIAKNQLFFHAFERVFYYPYKVYIYTVHTHNRISWSKSLDMLYNPDPYVKTERNF